ncbi:PBSX family phage terminase large subunit [Borrelia venezuelensis]|uniref:PBSX family phage terminase large subunit n=1 Tax=Borrelia venezuelensis TaxID=1653839 RepID=UPI001FF3D648|nr:PBSX family phage terminase large subunit [Borrelia venezuelensis]UPA12545.1 PBSX family phage terminase large subunit [Borrelia venezuelensis]
MDVYKLPLFREMQREYKRSFGIDISSFIKPKTVIIDFKEFESKYLTKKQRDVLNSIEKNKQTKIILSGGIASGKTFLACYLYLKTLIKNRHLYREDTNNFIIGNSQKSLEINVLGQFEKISNMLKVQFIPKLSNTSYFEVDNLRVNLYGGDKVRDFERFRGSNSACIFVNEATTLHKETLTECLKRLRVGQQTIIFDTNPESPEHFFKRDYIDNKETYFTYNFTTYDNELIPEEFIKTQETLYKDKPTYKSRVLLGNWVASDDVIFDSINVVDSYEFKSPIAYLDPAYSIGGDNTAICVLERLDNKFYAFIFQEKKPAVDPYMMNTIKKIIENLNVNTLYIEDRDDIRGAGALTREYIRLRENMNSYFRIAPIRPKTNKYTRIMSLLTPFAYNNMNLLSYSSSSVFNDIYSYRGDGKSNDDALDSLSASYLILSLNYLDRQKYFTKFTFI